MVLDLNAVFIKFDLELWDAQLATNLYSLVFLHSGYFLKIIDSLNDPFD